MNTSIYLQTSAANNAAENELWTVCPLSAHKPFFVPVPVVPRCATSCARSQYHYVPDRLVGLVIGTQVRPGWGAVAGLQRRDRR